ncbi:uncharacterized protein J3R85_006323 [Psidium guajava]|nr:uncharacterized protein J3R85_006323 [Psidium guajava]
MRIQQQRGEPEEEMQTHQPQHENPAVAGQMMSGYGSRSRQSKDTSGIRIQQQHDQTGRAEGVANQQARSRRLGKAPKTELRGTQNTQQQEQWGRTAKAAAARH